MFRVDDTGCLWATIVTIGVSSIASVATAAIASAISGEEFTVGDAAAAAIEGATATIACMLGIPVVLANPMATSLGGIIGKMIDNEPFDSGMKEVLGDTATTFLTTAGLGIAGKIIPKYVSGKYLELSNVGKVLNEVSYQPKYLDKTATKTIISENFWDSAKGLLFDVLI